VTATPHPGHAVSRPRLAVALRSPELRWVGGLTLAALALRVAFALSIERESLPFNDMLFYHSTAKALAEGLGFISLDQNPTARWPPAFPFLLSLVYRAFGSDHANAELMNAMLGAATVPLAYYAARRAFDRRTGLLAAGALAVMPGQILYAESILAEPLYTFVLVGILAMLVGLPDRRLSAAAIGLAIGVAALTRGEGLLLLALPPVVWWGAMPRRELLLRTGLAALAAVLAIAPWTVRNAFVVDAFVPVSTNSAQTFWAGHNPTANGGATYARGEIYAELQDLPPERFEVEQARLLRREALEYMFENPLRELTLIPRKLLYLSIGDSRAIQTGATLSERASQGAPVTGGITPVIVPTSNAAVLLGVVADVAWFGLLALFVLALVVLWPLLWRNPLGRAGIALTAISLVLYGFVLYGNFRYRMPLEPVMILLAAPLVSRLWERRALLRRPA
jgi:4-amino-4-deoxy-L-arabinose transferase-like glycosyltransferase